MRASYHAYMYLTMTSYILKLFRDYVFHSIGLDGNPVLDLSHVLTCLNKVSAAIGVFPIR